MAQLKFGAAGVSMTEIDLSAPLAAQPTGVPAGVIGTSLKGPAFVPLTVGLVSDFYAKFGPTDGKKFGPLAVSEWLRNAGSVTYVKVLGVGDGTQRSVTGDVNEAGFTVGENQPQASLAGSTGANPYANAGTGTNLGVAGRTYFLGCFMADQPGSSLLSDAGLVASGSGLAVPIVRGIVMAASGVVLKLSSSVPGVISSQPASSLVASETTASGSDLGDLVLLNGNIAKQDFVLLLNGLQGTNPLFPNVITASFDMTSPNYIANVLNTNPDNLQQAGHYLYLHYDIHPALAAATGSGIVTPQYGAGAATAYKPGSEPSAFILTSSLARDVGSTQVPDYEDFRDRFGSAQAPWVISQPFGGKAHNLFRVHALDDGAGVSTLYKVSIENIALSTDPSNQYGTFDLVIRQWGDNDLAPVYLEQFRGLTLNPGDSQYIAKVIGDAHAYFDFDRGPTAQKLSVEGQYPNASNYIRIEVDQSVDSGDLDPTALPVGLRGAHHLVTAGTGTLAAPTGSVLLSSSIAYVAGAFSMSSGSTFTFAGSYLNTSGGLPNTTAGLIAGGNFVGSYTPQAVGLLSGTYYEPNTLTPVFSGTAAFTGTISGISGTWYLTGTFVPANGAYLSANYGTFNYDLLTGSTSGIFASTVEPPVPFRLNITQGSGAKLQVNPLLYWGVQFEHQASVTTPNLSTQPNASLQAFATYLPEFREDVQNVRVGENTGTPPVAGAIIDADRFNFNLFSLMNIQVVTNSVGLADPTKWANATYVRNGNIPTQQNNPVYGNLGTRALQPSDFVQANRRFLKWSFFLQGGFDGTNLFDKDEREINSAAVEADMNATNRNTSKGATVSAYNKALQIVSDVTSVDIQLLAVPGIRHPVVTNAALSACEQRFDAMYLMDIEQLDNSGESVTEDSQQPSVTLTAQNFAERAVNSSFGAAYFPDVVMPDPNTNTNVVVPPSVVVLGALALNDAVGHPWFAPAGFTRGALQTTLEARVKLSKANMDALYDVNINPLVAFPGNASGGTNPKGGVVVWGQKTLQQAASALDRVNVRRLLIEIRRQVRDIANRILFEQNRAATLAAFSAAVTPVLQKIQAQAGLERFKVVIDSSTTTQLDIENNTIRGKIFVQPTKSIEYVSLDFVVTNNISQQV